MGENNKSLSYDFILGQKYKALQDRPLKFMSRYLDLKQSMQTNFFLNAKSWMWSSDSIGVDANATNSPPTLIGTGYQWTIPTSKGHL